LDRIRRAYDLTVEQYNQGMDPLAKVPAAFKNSPEFKAFMEDCRDCNTGASDVRGYLDPQPGMRFLDAGCGGGLASYHLYEWPSTYYGMDVSPKLINAMKDLVKREGIFIGGLYEADLSSLSFPDDFFDIATAIGVFEYYILEYIRKALKELHRVLKPQARVVMDIPNLKHPHVNIMFRLEEYLGRPNIPKERSAFEKMLRRLFSIERVDPSHVMLKYFIRTIKPQHSLKSQVA